MNCFDQRAISMCAILLCLGGCGSDNDLATIQGTVTCAGRPVEKGNISFQPMDGKGPTAAAVVADGTFTVKIHPGRKHVRIEGYRVTGQQPYRNNPNAPPVDVLEQIVPDRYNAKSELTCEIVAGGGRYNFELE